MFHKHLLVQISTTHRYRSAQQQRSDIARHGDLSEATVCLSEATVFLSEATVILSEAKDPPTFNPCL